jgi:hypothetical protein
MNPGPDSYGNPNVWNYMQSATLVHDGNYTLLPNFASDFLGAAGVDGWYGAGGQPPCAPPGGLPAVWINTNAEPMSFCGFNFTNPPGHAVLHPETTQDAIVGWRSPISGIVQISGGVKDIDRNGGNGISWFVDLGTTTLAHGKIHNGGKQRFPIGLTTMVSVGQFLYINIDPKAGDNGFDSTRVRLTITG